MLKTSTEEGPASIPNVAPISKIQDLNQSLLCTLCNGYLIDATTIIECLHSFCRSCIVKYLQTHKYCPICEVQVHKAKPLLNIRSDEVLQDIVYKLVPGLFQNEMHRRREFYTRNRTSIQNNVSTVDDDGPVCLSLEYDNSSSSTKCKNLLSLSSHRRFLRCPRAVRIYHLQKLLRSKYALDEKHHRVDVMCAGEKLNTEMTVGEMANIYLWRTKSPLHLTYKIFTAINNQQSNSNNTQTNTISNMDKSKTINITEKIINKDHDSWKEVQLQISENGVMSVTGINSENSNKSDTTKTNNKDTTADLLNNNQIDKGTTPIVVNNEKPECSTKEQNLNSVKKSESQQVRPEKKKSKKIEPDKNDKELGSPEAKRPKTKNEPESTKDTKEVPPLQINLKNTENSKTSSKKKETEIRSQENNLKNSEPITKPLSNLTSKDSNPKSSAPKSETKSNSSSRSEKKEDAPQNSNLQKSSSTSKLEIPKSDQDFSNSSLSSQSFFQNLNLSGPNNITASPKQESPKPSSNTLSQKSSGQKDETTLQKNSQKGSNSSVQKPNNSANEIQKQKPKIENTELKTKPVENLSSGHPLKIHSSSQNSKNIQNLVVPQVSHSQSQPKEAQSPQNSMPPPGIQYSRVGIVPKKMAPTYKTLRDPPKVWNPQIPFLVPPKSEQKPAKFFKARNNNMPRFLGNPASGVKPLFNVPPESESRPSTPRPLVTKIDPKTLKPITIPNNQLKINQSTVPIFNKKNLGGHTNNGANNSSRRKDSPPSPLLLNNNIRPQLSFTPPNPFIPNLASPNLPHHYLYNMPPHMPPPAPPMPPPHSLFYSPHRFSKSSASQIRPPEVKQTSSSSSLKDQSSKMGKKEDKVKINT